MSVGAKAGAVALAAVACVLLAPAAMASSGPVQFTGTQLKAALLPASDFVAGYTASDESDSGRHLEHVTTFSLRSMRCSTFWLTIGEVGGFGETAYAGDVVEDNTRMLSPQETFGQTIYQFASTRSAAWFFSLMMAKYRSCRSAGEPGGSGKTIRETLHSISALRVGGHQASRVIEYVTASRTPGPPLVIYLLWTVAGTDVYWISTMPLASGSPQPTQSSLTLKLIARVNALRPTHRVRNEHPGRVTDRAPSRCLPARCQQRAGMSHSQRAGGRLHTLSGRVYTKPPTVYSY